LNPFDVVPFDVEPFKDNSHHQKSPKFSTDQDSLDSLKVQLDRIEKQNKQLSKFSLLQTSCLGILIASYLIPNLFWYLKVAVVLLLLMGLLYLFRKQIPGWLGNVSRLIFAFFEDTQRKV